MKDRRTKGRPPAERRGASPSPRDRRPGPGRKAPPLPVAGRIRLNPETRLLRRRPPLAAKIGGSGTSRPSPERGCGPAREEEGGTSATLPDQSCDPHAGRSARACGGGVVTSSQPRPGCRAGLSQVFAPLPVGARRCGPCGCLRDPWPGRRAASAPGPWTGTPRPRERGV